MRKLLTWLFTSFWSLFTAKADERAIEADKSSLDAKLAQTKPILDNIEELKAQKNAKSGEVTVLADKAEADEAVVKQAADDTAKAIDRIRDVKQPQGDLAEKLDHLNLDDLP